MVDLSEISSWSSSTGIRPKEWSDKELNDIKEFIKNHKTPKTMNALNYHIQKEAQGKKINKVIQLAKCNHIEQSLKNLIIINGERALESINNERKEVYKQLENFEFNPSKYNSDHQIHQVAIPVSIEDTRFIETEIANVISALMDECTKMYMTAIVDSSTNEKFKPTDEYQNSAYELFQSLKTIHVSLGEANPPEEGVSASKDDNNIDFGEKEFPVNNFNETEKTEILEAMVPEQKKLSDGHETKEEYNPESDKKLPESEEEPEPPAVYTPEQPPVENRKENRGFFGMGKKGNKKK